MIPTIAEIARTTKPIYCFRGGIGDELLLSVVARELASRSGEPIRVMARHPELFGGNRNVERAISYSRTAFHLARTLSPRLREITYTRYLPETDACAVPPWHISALLCAFVGVTGRIQTQPELFLSDSEKESGRLAERQIAIHSSGRASRFPILNKEWFVERFQAVVDALSAGATIVQLGSPRDPLLDGTLDLRGKTTLRETAAILARSALFVGLQGFLMHLARAVSCPAVIIYGGRERPEQSGYSCNRNLTTSPPCSPCWQWSRCDFDRQCMREITAEMVIAQARKTLDEPDAPPAIDGVEITPQTADAMRAFLRDALRGDRALLRALR